MGRLGWVMVGGLIFFAVVLSNTLLFTLGLLLGLLGLASALWSRYCLVEVRYRRRLGTTRLFYGEQTDLWIEVTNAKPLPLAWLRTEDEVPAALEMSPEQQFSRYHTGRRLLINLFSLRWYERVTRRYHITGTARGAWHFGPVRLISGDIFGFSLKREVMEGTDTLLVYPQLFPLKALGLPAQHPFGNRRAHRRVVDDPMRLMGVRDYQPGDNFRTIHWKASARRQDLQTKVFEPSASRLLLIFLNVDTVRNRLQGSDPELREYLISAAASIARYAWEGGETVGLYANGLLPSGMRLRVPPGSRSDQVLRVLEGLAWMRPVSQSPIERVISVETESLRFGSTVVVVTGFVDQPLAAPLVDLGRRGHAVSVVHGGSQPPEYVIPGVRIYSIGNGKQVNGNHSEAEGDHAKRTLELA